MSVIVTNAKNRIAYNVVKSLGRRGIDVYTADFVPRSMSFVSRYSKGHFLYPSPFREQEGFISSLIHYGKQLKARALIPVFEETFLIAKHKDRLVPFFSMAVPDYEQILTVHNKDRWENVAHKLGIPFPKSYSIEDLKEQPSLISDLKYPVFIKPKQGGGAWGIRKIATPGKLHAVLNRGDYCNQPWCRFFVQEMINGHTVCVAMLFRSGELRAKVAYRQLRDFPATGGQATLRVSIRNEKAEGYLQVLLEELRWHGVCQADFIVDTNTGIPYLIDVNPRLWGSLVQAIASGVDFPFLLYILATEGDVRPVELFKTGVVTRWIGGDLLTFLPLLKRSRKKTKFIGDFLIRDTAGTQFDDFSLTDPLPFVYWLADAVYRVAKNRSFGRIPHDSLDGVWE